MKGPFDAGIKMIYDWAKAMRDGGLIKQAIKLEACLPVLEAAARLAEMKGKGNDPKTVVQRLRAMDELTEAALSESLAEPEEEPKIYRCESCGREFDHKIFSHGRAEDDGHGNPIEVECGPISEVKNSEKEP